MKVLLSSTCLFRLSREAVLRARRHGAAWAKDISLKGEPGYLESVPESYDLPHGVPRHDKVLFRVFEELGGGDAFHGEGGEVRVTTVELPDDVTYCISSHLSEFVVEQHRIWGVGYSMEGEPWSRTAFDKKSTYPQKNT